MKPRRLGILAVAIAALMLLSGPALLFAAQTQDGPSPKQGRAVTKVPARPLPPAVAAPPTSRVPTRVTPPPPPQNHDDVGPPPTRTYPPNVEAQCVTIVPNLIGHDLKAAAPMLGNGLSIGNIVRRPAAAPPGFVIDQTPRPGTRMRCGSTVNVLIAEQESPRCQVPALVNARVDGPATGILESRRLRLGRISSRQDPRPKGTIIDQSPEPGAYVPCGSPVNVLVAVPLPPDIQPTCRVPRLLGADARTITNILGDARLSPGSISSRQDARPAGTVIAQRPFADALVSCGSPVDVIVAGDAECTVPSLIGHDEKQAIELISGAQLRVGSVRRQESDQAGSTILTQSFGPGTTVKCDTAIDVVVAQHVTRVPLLSGNDVPAAGRRLTQSGLRLGKTLERESTAAPGSVVDQMPVANTIVNPDSPVDVWVAVRKPVIVPDLQGQDRARAGQTLTDIGLNFIVLGKRESNEKADSVIGQVPAANTSVRWGAAVGVWLAIPVPPPPVAWVPSLIGVAQTEALGLVGNAKLTPGAISQRESSQTPGTVLDQRPAAGTQVQPGTAVDFTLAVPVRKSNRPRPGWSTPGWRRSSARSQHASNRWCRFASIPGAGRCHRRPEASCRTPTRSRIDSGCLGRGTAAACNGDGSGSQRQLSERSDGVNPESEAAYRPVRRAREQRTARHSGRAGSAGGHGRRGGLVGFSLARHSNRAASCHAGGRSACHRGIAGQSGFDAR